MRRVLWAACLVALFAGGTAFAAAVKIPQAPVMWVTDKSDFLSETVRRDLDTKLYLQEQKSGHQILVYISKSTGETPLEEWCVKAFESWGVGKKGKDDGLVLFLFSEDQKLRIEVGYGLEDKVPDAVAWRIINEVITPKLKSGDRDGAVTSGVDAILDAVEGKPFGDAASPPAQASTAEKPGPASAPRAPTPLWQVILFVVLGIGFLILLITHPSFALWLLFQILSAALSGGGGGGGRGGGGWSGGGGRSGGGGASGSW